MLFNQNVASARGSGSQSRGFLSLRRTLFFACAQDIANLIADSDPRAPSIHNIAQALHDGKLVAQLKVQYSEWVVPSIEDETDPEIVEALRMMELSEREQRAIQFDEQLTSLKSLADELTASRVVRSFRMMRDKITAHTEVRFVADKYRPVDIAELGIKWRDLKDTIALIQHAVELIGMVVRNSGFARELLDRQLSKSANEFWLPGAPSEVRPKIQASAFERT